ncbi:MAG: hypothetical protein ACI4JA_02390 [Oscillospiraceae bacterium]
MKIKICILALLAAACLTGCGSGDDSSEKSGKVSLNSSSEQSSSADVTSAADSSATTTTTTTASTTQTTAQETTVTTVKTTTTTTQTEAELPAPDSFAGKIRVSYNGAEFGIGDKMSDIESKLGSQPAPSAEVGSCLGDKTVDEYYFYGMTIQVNEGVVFSIDIMDNGYYGDISPKTAAGLSCSMTKADVEGLYGASSKSDEYNLYYTEGSCTMQVSIFDDSVGRIWINDSSLG